MADYKSLRNRAAKNSIEDLRVRVTEAYSHDYISRRRMLLLLAILDAFEREAFLPWRKVEAEMNDEKRFDKGIDKEKSKP